MTDAEIEQYISATVTKAFSDASVMVQRLEILISTVREQQLVQQQTQKEMTQ